MLDKKLETGPNARAGGNCFHLSHKAAISRHAQDMILGDKGTRYP